MNDVHITRGALVALAVLGVSPAVAADPTGKYAAVDPSIKDWISNLQPVGGDGKSGNRCCSLADGLLLQDTQWEYGKNTYRVFIVTPEGYTFPDGSEGQWADVPPETVVVEPNKLGHAVVWVNWSYTVENHVNGYTIRCFLPGAGL